MRWIDDLLVGLIGRPILKLIKWGRWYFLAFTLIAQAVIWLYPDMRGSGTVESHIPLMVSVIIYAVGTAIKRYDEICDN